MPTETVIVLTLVCVVFFAFAGSLAWLQWYARDAGHHTPAE